MTEDELAEVYLQVRDRYPKAGQQEIAELIVWTLSADHARDLAILALANEDTMETTHGLAVGFVRDYVEVVESGPDGDPGHGPV